MDKTKLIKRVRALGGYQAVATIMDTERQYIHRWVNRKCPAEKVRPLAKVLDVHPSDLRPDIFGDVA